MMQPIERTSHWWLQASSLGLLVMVSHAGTGISSGRFIIWTLDAGPIARPSPRGHLMATKPKTANDP